MDNIVQSNDTTLQNEFNTILKNVYVQNLETLFQYFPHQRRKFVEGLGFSIPPKSLNHVNYLVNYGMNFL